MCVSRTLNLLLNVGLGFLSCTGLLRLYIKCCEKRNKKGLCRGYISFIFCQNPFMPFCVNPKENEYIYNYVK